METQSSKILCGHLRATLDGIIPVSEIQALVGVLSNFTEPTFKEVAEEISTIFTSALIGQFYLEPQSIPHFRTVVRSNEVGLPQGLTFQGSFRILNSILELDPTLASTQKIWAGLTNLKSVVLRLDSRLSKKDRVKAYYAITHTTEIANEVLEEYESFINEYVPYLVKGMEFPDPEYLPVWAISASGKRFAHITPKGNVESLSRLNDGLFDISSSFKNIKIRALAIQDPSEFLTRALYGHRVMALWDESSFPEAFPEETAIGKTSESPKNGSKVRLIAMLEILLASLAFPLGKRLKSINSQTTIQWVDDQDGARRDLFEMIGRNVSRAKPNTFRSFDQSSFTDNFSYEKIQRPVLILLKELGVVTDFDIHVMDTICYGLYDLSNLRKDYIGRYGTGTPMGSYPSFPLASLTNGVLAAWAFFKTRGRFPDKRSHYAWIVGDDSVFSDGDVGDAYENICNQIGLKVNTSKSISSFRVVEFCSTFITPQGVFKKKKLPEFTQLGSLVEAICYYGPDKFVQGFPEFRVLTKEIQAIPKPYGLGPEVDLKQRLDLEEWETNPSRPIQEKIKAKQQFGQISNLWDHVSEARDFMHGFERAGISAELEEPKGPYPSHTVVHHERDFIDSEPAWTPMEYSMLDEAEHLIRCINSQPLDSVFTQESCVRMNEIYSYFLENYRELLERIPVNFRIAPPPSRKRKEKEDERNTHEPTSELQSLVTDLRSIPDESVYEGLTPTGD